MGSFANILFRLMLGWIQRVVADIRSLFVDRNGTSLIRWTGEHWLAIALILCVTGLIIDLIVYMFRWRPYKVWASFFRRRRENRYSSHSDMSEIIPDNSYQETTENEQQIFSRKARYMTGQNDTDESSDGEPQYTASFEEHDADRRSHRTGGKEGERSYTPAAPVYGQYREESTTERFENAIRPRRRRSYVADLFADEKEYHYDAPQTLIDTNEAYYRPVYPKGWSRTENGRGEQNDSQ